MNRCPNCGEQPGYHVAGCFLDGHPDDPWRDLERVGRGPLPARTETSGTGARVARDAG